MIQCKSHNREKRKGEFTIISQNILLTILKLPKKWDWGELIFTYQTESQEKSQLAEIKIKHDTNSQKWWKAIKHGMWNSNLERKRQNIASYYKLFYRILFSNHTYTSLLWYILNKSFKCIPRNAENNWTWGHEQWVYNVTGTRNNFLSLFTLLQ